MARVKVRTYLSPTLVLLAFDWGAGRSRDDFLGFAIERRPGFWGAASSWLPNRIGFDGPARDGDLPPPRLREALAWLANGMQDVVLGFLDRSERAAGAIYHLTDREWVMPALAAHPGTTSLVYNKTARDDGNRDSVTELTPEVEFFPRTKAAIMHDKFLVRLERGRPVAVLMGSANFTTQGIASQANLMHTFASPELAALYLERARLLQGDPAIRQTTPHAGWSAPVQVGGASVRAFFPPEPSRRRASIDTVVQAVDRARSSVVFSLFKPTDRALFDALERHGQAGKLLFGLVNKLDRPAEAADEPSPGAERARVDILHRSVLARETVDHGLFPRGGEPAGFWWERAALPGMASRFPVYIHHKFVVIDAETAHPVIYTGSANMSNNAVHRNDENLLEVAGSPRLAAVYLAEFLRLYEHYRARRHIDRPGRRRPDLALAKDASWARNAFRPGTSQFLSRVRLAAAPR